MGTAAVRAGDVLDTAEREMGESGEREKDGDGEPDLGWVEWTVYGWWGVAGPTGATSPIHV